jgi:uncharacterized protein involved in exopolysaccharide biosynthesis
MNRQHKLLELQRNAFMSPQLDLERFQPFNLRAHYEDVAVNTLRSIARHAGLIIALVAAPLALAGLVVSQLPRGYSAEALVHPDLFRSEEGTKYMQLANIEGASLVSSEAQLIRSPTMVRAVVKRLGLDEDPEFVSPSSAFLDRLAWLREALLPETIVSSPLERAAARVHQRLTVANDTRSYLIAVSFTAASPEKAAKVANAFALEYVRGKTVQRLGDAVAAASRELARQSAIYGERHPSMSQVKTELEAARLRLQAAVNGPKMAAREIVPGDGVTLAEPNPTPSSPRGVVILGLTFLAAAASGMGLAVWRDRLEAARRRALFAVADVPRPHDQNAGGGNGSENRGARTGAGAVGTVRAQDLEGDPAPIKSA